MTYEFEILMVHLFLCFDAWHPSQQFFSNVSDELMVYNFWFFISQMKDRVSKFENFLKENELKRRRAIQKYQTEVKLKEQKSTELEQLEEELEMLKTQ